MNRVVVIIMMVFMILGAVDKAILNNRLGYGPEFEKGICAMGPLTIMMAGIMCAAPALGKLLAPVFSPVLSLMGADTGMAGGMFFAIDMGGFPLAGNLTDDPDIFLLSGVSLASTLGTAITFIIPVGLRMCPGNRQSAAARGIVAGIIASPVSALVGGLLAGIAGKKIFFNILPSVLLAVFLAAALTCFQRRTIAFFLGFSKVLSSLGVLWLMAAILEELLGLVVIPGMAPLAEQLLLIGEIGITLAGAYPMVRFIQALLSPAFAWLAAVLRIDETAACAMMVSAANPLPVFEMAGRMSERGIILAFAFLTPASALLGDHLGYVFAVFPEGVTAMLAGKMAAALAAVGIAVRTTASVSARH